MEDKITFKRDENTGEVFAYKNGKKLSKITSMGDEIKTTNKKDPTK